MGRLVYNLLDNANLGDSLARVTPIGRSGMERFATFLGIHGEFGTT